MDTERDLSILHIGYPKTATTWFQREFFPKVRNIEYYNHKKIIKLLGTEWRYIRSAEDIKKVLMKGNKRLIISDESMLESSIWIEINAQNFKNIFYPAQIIIFIRNQPDIYLSDYNQYVKLGGTAKFQDFIFSTPDQVYASKKYNYADIICLYKNKFGESNVYVYLYEEFQSDFNNFIDRFCVNHGLELKTRPINNIRLNKSLSPLLIPLKRFSNSFSKHQPYRIDIANNNKTKLFLHIPYWFEFTYVVFELINKLIPKNKNSTLEELIGIEQAQKLQKFFAESNRRLIKEHGLSRIANYNYPL